MNKEPLHRMEVSEWSELKNAFKKNWSKGITGYYTLDTLAKVKEMGLDFEFKMFNPFGEPDNGIICILGSELTSTTLLIEYPKEDTTLLEKALTTTSLINWNNVVVLFPQTHVVECLKRIAKDLNVFVLWETVLQLYVLDKDTPLFDVSLPEGLIFKLLTEEFTDFVNTKWPHRYPNSRKYFHFLIQGQFGYGLFKDDQLISWGFIKETGALGHIFTLEKHRKKGYGAIVTKLICNEILKNKNDVLSQIQDGNVASSELHLKLGFKEMFDVYTIGLKRNKSETA